MAEIKLSKSARETLIPLARERGEGWLTAGWIAKGCRQYYDPPLFSRRLLALLKRGLVERSSDPRWYRITEAGRSALHPDEVGK